LVPATASSSTTTLNHQQRQRCLPLPKLSITLYPSPRNPSQRRMRRKTSKAPTMTQHIRKSWIDVGMNETSISSQLAYGRNSTQKRTTRRRSREMLAGTPSSHRACKSFRRTNLYGGPCNASSWSEKVALILMFQFEWDIEIHNVKCRFLCPRREWSAIEVVS
jgi:hypothetical protein